MVLLPPAPQAGASASSATSALEGRNTTAEYMADAGGGQLPVVHRPHSPTPITSNAETALTQISNSLASGLLQHPTQEDDISVSLYDGSVDELAVR